MVDSEKFIKLQKSDFDKNTRLTFQPEYYECTACLEIPTASSILECPQCGVRNCKDCLVGFTVSKTKKQVVGDQLTCTICLTEFKMKEPNKTMMQLLTNVIKFECNDCQRHWNYIEFQSHKMQNKCKKDPNAVNNIKLLN